MQMTASSGYAIHGLAYLAYKGGDTVIYLSEIAEFFSIPSSYLAKVFQALARGGLVVSYRGAKGGYALARPGNEISLRQVIEIFEGPIRNDCPLMRSPCNVRTLCSVSSRIGLAQQAFLDELDRHTIAEIGDYGDHRCSLHRARVRYGDDPSWPAPAVRPRSGR